MGKCLNCLEYTKHYKYIWIAILFGLLNDCLSGMNYYGIFKEIKIFPGGAQNKFKNHGLIHQIFNYFGTFLISLFILLNQQKKWFKKKPKSKKIEKIANKLATKISLIHYKAEQNYQVNIFSFLIIIFSLVLLDQVIEKYNSTISHLDFWMIELIIISYLNSKLFKMQIYRHQKFVLFFNLFPILFKIITIYYTFKDTNDYKPDYENDYNKYQDGANNDALKIIYVVFWYWIIIGLIIYIPLIVLRSYSYIQLKWFMDIKYISENKLLLNYGCIGTIFYTIIVTITTFIKCKNEDKLGPTDYICSIKNGDATYFESFSIYFKTKVEIEDIFKEFIIIILGMITFYFYKYYSLMIIKYLTPIHLIFLSPIYFFISKIMLVVYFGLYLLVNGKGSAKLNWDDDKTKEYKKHIFFLDISGDIFSIFGFLIYLEVIEFSCFGLNKDYRKNIMRRGTEECINILEDLTDDISETGNDDDIETKGTIELISQKSS